MSFYTLYLIGQLYPIPLWAVAVVTLILLLCYFKFK
jgi:hypothetical protein